VGFDSNIYRTRVAEGIRRGAYALPSAWVSVSNTPMRDGQLDTSPALDGRNVDYSLSIGLGYRAYLSGEEDIQAAGKFSADIQAHVMGRPAKRLSIYFDESLRRIGEPRNFEGAREANFNRIDHRMDLGLRMRPGGGRLGIRLGFHNEVLYFGAEDLVNGDRTVNGMKTQVRWRFRDRMSLLVRYSLLKYFHFCCTEVGEGRNEDSTQHRVLGGFAGQLGKRWALEVLGGWGWGLYKDDVNGPDHKNFLLQSSLVFFPRERAEFRLSAHRKFDDALWGNYFTDFGGRFEAQYTFKWRMNLYGGILVSQRKAAGLPVPGLETQTVTEYFNAPGFVREDIIVASQVRLSQALKKIFVVGLQYDLTLDKTDFQANFANGSFDLGGFTRHMVMVFGAIRY
jgi:hypothetical protein